MSVTFAAQTGPVSGHRVHCGCEDNQTSGAVFGDVADAQTEARKMRAERRQVEGCADDLCIDYGPWVSPVEDEVSPAFTATNVDVGNILDALGLPRDGDEQGMTGAADAADFLGRVLVAQGLAPVDAGLPRTERGGPGSAEGGPRWINMGRAPGYLQEGLAVLHEVAEFAARTGRRVVWC